MVMIEIWRELVHNGEKIPDYYVSDMGNLVHIDSTKFSFRVLKKQNNIYKERGNYQAVTIRGKRERVHRLVAETFLPLDEFPPIPIEDWLVTPASAKEIIALGLYVDHIDCDPFNNRASNLQWVTPKDNNHHVKKRRLGVL